MSDFLSEKREEIQSRLDEIQPLIAEHDRLRRALDALNGVEQSTSTAAASKRGAGRPRGSGDRSRQALEAIQQEPGLRASEVAERIGVHPNYAYRILPTLEEQGAIEKRDKRWYARNTGIQ